MDVNEELKFLGNFTKKNWGGGGLRGGFGLEGVRVVGGQGGCERKIEVFVKIHKKKFWGGVGLGGGVSVDVKEDLKFL